MEFKQIPPELINNHIIFASKDGQIKINEKLIEGCKGIKGANGFYKNIKYKTHNYYFHRLVFFAHSDLSIEHLKNGRVIFKNFNPDMVDEYNVYKNRFEDLLFEPFKKIKEDVIVESVDAKHPIYGKFKYNVWHGCIGKEINFVDYKIMPLNSSDSCIVKNIKTNKILCTKSNNNYDPSINLVHNKKSYGLLLSHLLLNSIFPSIKINETVDHIDDNPLNNNIINLQWMSIKDNSKKGQIKSTKISNNNKTLDIFEVFNLKEESVGKFKMKKDLVEFMVKRMNIKSDINTAQGKIDRALKTDGFAYSHKYKLINQEQNDNVIESDTEVWKELNIDESTKKYKISDKGNIKLNDELLKPYKIRGRKYSQFSINGNKYYVHQLVWLAHKGSIPDNMIILHDDSVELVDNYYRNWLCDLKLGTGSDNNKEYHINKRNNL